MKRNPSIKSKRFHYCMPMEIAEQEYFGVNKRPAGMASAYSNCSYFKKRSRILLNKIIKRIENIITGDETLRLMLVSDIRILDIEFKELSHENYSEIDIIASFFSLIAHLLGWAHFEGKFYRTPIYHQTDEQQMEDLRKMSTLKLPYGLYECYKRRRIIKQLLSEGNSYTTVAQIMRLTVSNIKQLEKAKHIDDMYEKILIERNKNVSE